MTTWQVVLADPTATIGNLGELIAARSRKLSWRLDDAASMTFALDGRDRLGASIAELATDVIVYADGAPLFRGRIGASDDTVSTNSHDATFSAIDYRGLLHRRILWPGATLVYSQVDQADIAWDLINDAQGRVNGSLGIARGNAAATGVLRDRTFNVGANVGETITNLGRVSNGFEWEISATRQFNLFFPQRGATGITPLVWGDNVTEVRRALDTADFANAVRVSGETASATRENTALPEGRWERQVSDTDLKESATVGQRADFELVQGQDIRPNHQLALTPGWWSPSLVWLGDVNRLVIRSGRLNVDTLARVTQIDVDLSDESNQENVTLQLGPSRLNLAELLTDQRRAITNLGRR